MQYSAVFSMSSDLSPAQSAPLFVVALVGVALVAVATWVTIYKPRRPYTPQVRFYSVALAIGLSIIIFAMYSIKSNHDSLVEAVNKGNVAVVEGAVENFHPMPVQGHDTERFSVAGTQFAYSDYMQTGGFNNSASHGGPIREGLPVRITYVPGSYNNVIVKLEIGHT